MAINPLSNNKSICGIALAARFAALIFSFCRELNRFVKDLLGIKNRSKSIRMDNPKKAAEKLLQFYEGQKLQELLVYLREGLKATTDSPLTQTDEQSIENNSNGLKTIDEKNKTTQNSKESQPLTDNSAFSLSEEENRADTPYRQLESKQTSQVSEKAPETEISKETNNFDGAYKNSSSRQIDKAENTDSSDKKTITSHTTKESPVEISSDDSTEREELRLTRSQLGERFGLNPKSISNFLYKQPENFSDWTQKKDPEGIAWQKEGKKEGRSYYFIPVQTVNNE